MSVPTEVAAEGGVPPQEEVAASATQKQRAQELEELRERQQAATSPRSTLSTPRVVYQQVGTPDRTPRAHQHTVSAPVAERGSSGPPPPEAVLSHLLTTEGGEASPGGVSTRSASHSGFINPLTTNEISTYVRSLFKAVEATMVDAIKSQQQHQSDLPVVDVTALVEKPRVRLGKSGHTAEVDKEMLDRFDGQAQQSLDAMLRALSQAPPPQLVALRHTSPIGSATATEPPSKGTRPSTAGAPSTTSVVQPRVRRDPLVAGVVAANPYTSSKINQEYFLEVNQVHPGQTKHLVSNTTGPVEMEHPQPGGTRNRIFNANTIQAMDKAGQRLSNALVGSSHRRPHTAGSRVAVGAMEEQEQLEKQQRVLQHAARSTSPIFTGLGKKKGGGNAGLDCLNEILEDPTPEAMDQLRGRIQEVTVNEDGSNVYADRHFDVEWEDVTPGGMEIKRDKERKRKPEDLELMHNLPEARREYVMYHTSDPNEDKKRKEQILANEMEKFRRQVRGHRAIKEAMLQRRVHERAEDKRARDRQGSHPMSRNPQFYRQENIAKGIPLTHPPPQLDDSDQQVSAPVVNVPALETYKGKSWEMAGKAGSCGVAGQSVLSAQQRHQPDPQQQPQQARKKNSQGIFITQSRPSSAVIQRRAVEARVEAARRQKERDGQQQALRAEEARRTGQEKVSTTIPVGMSFTEYAERVDNIVLAAKSPSRPSSPNKSATGQPPQLSKAQSAILARLKQSVSPDSMSWVNTAYRPQQQEQ